LSPAPAWQVRPPARFKRLTCARWGLRDRETRQGRVKVLGKAALPCEPRGDAHVGAPEPERPPQEALPFLAEATQQRTPRGPLLRDALPGRRSSSSFRSGPPGPSLPIAQPSQAPQFNLLIGRTARSGAGTYGGFFPALPRQHGPSTSTDRTIVRSLRATRKMEADASDVAWASRPLGRGYPFAALRACSACAPLRLVLALARPLFPGVERDFPGAGARRSRPSGRDARATSPVAYSSHSSRAPAHYRERAINSLFAYTYCVGP
jgi:hypothetical protein